MSDAVLYIADETYRDQLAHELGESADIEEVAGGCFLVSGPARPVAWAQCTWLNVERVAIQSIHHDHIDSR